MTNRAPTTSRLRSSFVRHFSALCIAGIGALTVATTVNAQTYNTTFGGAGFTCFSLPGYCEGTDSGRPAPSLLTVGAFWNQSISGSGIASVSSLSLGLIMPNVLVGTSHIQFDVLLNGVTVGSTPTYFSTNYAAINAPLSFNFQAISASTYDVKVRVSSATVASTGEGISLYTDGVSTIQLSGAQTIAPEPGTYALMAAGLAGLGYLARRRNLRA